MKLKDLFKKKAPRPEYLPDEELVSAIRDVMGDRAANLVKNRIDTAKEHEADIAELESELANVTEYYTNDIKHMRTGMQNMFSDLCAIVGSMPVRQCGKFCFNGFPGQTECPTRDMTQDELSGLKFCRNCHVDCDWQNVLDKKNPRALLLRKRDNGRITDEEKDELLRSEDAKFEEEAEEE